MRKDTLLKLLALVSDDTEIKINTGEVSWAIVDGMITESDENPDQAEVTLFTN